jgi:hypothetical protein
MDADHKVKQYEAAALVHDRAAEFWERQGRPDKATVEREQAESNRFYADFEAERLRRGQEDGQRAATWNEFSLRVK